MSSDTGERLRIDALLNGEGFVLIDEWAVQPMIGPYRTRKQAAAGRASLTATLATERAAAKAEGAREAVDQIRAQVISDLVDEKGDIWTTQQVHDWIMPIVGEAAR